MRSLRTHLAIPSSVVIFAAVAGATFFASPAPRAHASPPGTGASTTPTTVPVQHSPSEVASGKALFIANCSTCHGTNAEGSAYAPNLVGLGAATIDFWVGTGRMPLPFLTAQAPEKKPLFSVAQRHAIVSYVTSLGKGGPGIPKVNLKGANVATGEQLFSLNCAGCHTIAGVGDALSAGYYAPSLYPATSTQVAEAMRTGPGNMPRFGPHDITPQQLDDVVAYVHRYIQHPVDRGGEGLGHVGPVAEGFVAFLFGVGSLLLLSYWIGEPAEKREGHGAGA